jgi:hypothetical protein
MANEGLRASKETAAIHIRGCGIAPFGAAVLPESCMKMKEKI